MSEQQGYDQTDRGALFANKRKTPGDSKPDYNGKLNIRGTEFWLSGWVKTPKAGGPKFLSLKIGEAVNAPRPAAPPAGGGAAPGEDEIPF